MATKQKNRCRIIFETTFHRETPDTIADFLKQTAPVSGRSLRQYFFKGLILLNHKKAHSQARLKNGDLIQIIGGDQEQQTLNPETIPLDIVYENDELLIINKPANLVVHPSGNITSGTLANGVAAYFEKKGLKLKVRPVNRLDYGTSGLIIFAKNAASQNVLAKEIRENRIHRIYYAVVNGIPSRQNGVIDFSIAERKGKRIISEQGQPAVTLYRVREEFNGCTLLELSLETGRTHQIRVHLSHIGHPILGDSQYGITSLFIQRPALHAGKLDFADSGLLIPDLAAPYPDDFSHLLHVLRQNRQSGT